MTDLHSNALAVIVGRAGSKGLPEKNARNVAGRPMIAWTIQHARASQCVDRIVVSTDGESIADAAGAEGVEVIRRPPMLATDTASVDAAVRHAVETTQTDHRIIVILYANVPVRPAGLIDRAITLLVESGADSVQSYEPVGKRHPWWMTRLDEAGRIVPWHRNDVYRRQDLPSVHFPDGGVIALRRDALFTVEEGEPHAFLGRDRRGIENGPGEVVDVDDEIDLLVAEAMLSRSSAARTGS